MKSQRILTLSKSQISLSYRGVLTPSESQIPLLHMGYLKVSQIQSCEDIIDIFQEMIHGDFDDASGIYIKINTIFLIAI